MFLITLLEWRNSVRHYYTYDRNHSIIEMTTLARDDYISNPCEFKELEAVTLRHLRLYHS
jgi:DNA-binding response OmpR family regulator